jgi:hypothetical protein
MANIYRVCNGVGRIALDQNKNVYVSGYKTNNVVILSPDGTNCRQILTKSDGLNGPFSLRINFERSKTKGPQQDSQSRLRLPFPGEENLSFINVRFHNSLQCTIRVQKL